MSSLRRTLEALCGLLAATALFAIMVLTFIDVGGRKLLSQSVPGSLELTELLMVVVIFAALPLVSLHGEHVVFDSLDPLLERWMRRAQGTAVDIFCTAALAGVAWLLWTKAGELLSYGETTAQLHVPKGWFVYVMSVLAAATAVVHALLVVAPVSHHHPGVQEEGSA